MNLYLIWQNKNLDYDAYDSAVVAAETEKEARATHPDDTLPKDPSLWKRDIQRAWVSSPDDVEVKLIGEAAAGTEAGVILASYNAR